MRGSQRLAKVTFLLHSTSLTDTMRAYFIHTSCPYPHNPGNSMALSTTHFWVPSTNSSHQFYSLYSVSLHKYTDNLQNSSHVCEIGQHSHFPLPNLFFSLWTILYLLEDLFSFQLLKSSLWCFFIL